MSEKQRFLASLQAAWREEMTSALTYRAAAGQEPDAQRRAIFIRLAEEKEKHAARWESRLRELGAARGMSIRPWPHSLPRSRTASDWKKPGRKSTPMT